MDIHGATDLGIRRQRNEDSHAWWIAENRAEHVRRGALLVVADGMGGAKSGGVASRLAVETVIRTYQEAPGTDVVAELRQSVTEANRRVHTENLSHHELSGMATTLTALVVRGRELFLAHVGDSRAYVVRDGMAHQLSEDHSFVGMLVAQGQISKDEARVHPRRNLLTRSVGGAPEVLIDAGRCDWTLAPGDTLLLCSDGLHGLLADEELARAAGGQDLGRVCDELIQLANHAGGDDNITVLVARVAESELTGGPSTTG